MKILIFEILGFHHEVLEIHFENVALDYFEIFLQLKLSRFVSIGMKCILELDDSCPIGVSADSCPAGAPCLRE